MPNSFAVIIEKPEIPPMFFSLKPQLYVEAPKALEAVQFFKDAFGAEEEHHVMQNKGRDGQENFQLVLVELKIGSFKFLVSDITDDSHPLVRDGAGSRCVMCLDTANLDAAVERAVTAGAIKVGEMPGGVTGAGVGGANKVILNDPYGNVWEISSKEMETPSPSDMSMESGQSTTG